MATILLVEDDKFFLALYKNKLTVAGFEVITAEDGERAIEEIINKKPDLVILDLIMPKKNGFEVLIEIRSNDLYKDIPVIVFSSLNQNEDIEKVKNLGVNDFFDKSTTDFKTLKQKIDGVLL